MKPILCSLILSLTGRAAAQPLPSSLLTPQTPLPGTAIPRFVQKLPVLDVTSDTVLWAAYPKIATVLPSERTPGEPFTLRMCEFKSKPLPPGTVATNPSSETSVWGYAKGSCPTAPQETYVGPVFVNVRGTPTSIRFVNALPRTAGDSNVLAYRDSVDATLHWADPDERMCSMAGMAWDPTCAFPFRDAGIPAVPHLHGGEVPPEIDGGPDAWFTSAATDATRTARGAAYYTDPRWPAAANEAVFTYPNLQEAAPLWFHDHTLGATRLNVYAGLAGGYVLLDPAQDVPASLKDPTNVVPLVLQDRMFDTNGELFFTAGSKGGVLWALNPEHPYWNPEFVGDTAVVNGKAWPYVEVEPKRYRFLFLNGSNARTYELFLVDRASKRMGPPLYVVATDGGYLDTAVKIDPNAAKGAPTKLVTMPGERYEVVVDFSTLKVGTRLFLKNVARTPYPGGATPTGGMSQLLELRVTCPATGPCPSTPGLAWDPAVTPTIRATAKLPQLVNFGTGTPSVAVQQTRLLTLNEVMGAPVTAVDPVTGALTAYPGGPLEILVNNTKWSGASARNDPGSSPQPPPSYRGDFTQVGGTWFSELPQEGDVELWELVNLTADAHPIHLHLVQFQILNRQSFDVTRYDAVYGAAFPAVLDPTTGQPVMIGMNTCSGGVYCPGYGPPLHYATGTPGKLGGNPDVKPALKGLPRPAEWQERGWKDTVQAPPGMVTRVLVRWAPTDRPANAAPAELAYPFDPNAGFTFGYVWHCHLIDHEDNEMMRPDLVRLNPAAPPPSERPLVQGADY